MFFKYSKLVLLTKEHLIIIGYSRENPCDWLISCKVAPSGFTNEQLLNRTTITEQNPTSEPKNCSRIGTATPECSGDQGSVLFSFLQNLNAWNAYLICKNGVSITTILEQWRHTTGSARILSGIDYLAPWLDLPYLQSERSKNVHDYFWAYFDHCHSCKPMYMLSHAHVYLLYVLSHCFSSSATTIDSILLKLQH